MKVFFFSCWIVSVEKNLLVVFVFSANINGFVIPLKWEKKAFQSGLRMSEVSDLNIKPAGDGYWKNKCN